MAKNKGYISEEIEKHLWADVFFIQTPTYWMSVPYLFKKYMLSSTWNTPPIFTSGPDLDRTFDLPFTKPPNNGIPVSSAKNTVICAPKIQSKGGPSPFAGQIAPRKGPKPGQALRRTTRRPWV